MNFILFGDTVLLAEECGVNARMRAFAAPIYSVREQCELPGLLPSGASLMWSPHYNVPLFSAVPLLVTIHDALHVAMPELFPGRFKQLYAALMFRAALWKSRTVLANSLFTKEELRRLFGRFAQKEKIRVIHLGVDAEWFDLAIGTRPCEKPFVLYVGNVKPHKNLRGLVAAFGAMKDRVDVDLVIVGEQEGFLTGDCGLMEVAEPLGSRVKFTGRVSVELLRQYYVHAAALILPSFYEGFGLTALEAMAAGCPVVASRVASIPEVCGNAAVYFDPDNIAEMAEVIQRTLSDAPLREKMRRRGFQRACEFQWETTAERTVDAIKELLV